MNNVWETSQRSEVEKFTTTSRFDIRDLVQVCAENFSSLWKFVAYLRETLHVFHDLVKNFAEQVTTSFVSLFIHLYYSVASLSLFLFLHFPIMFRMAWYSAPLSFFLSSTRDLRVFETLPESTVRPLILRGKNIFLFTIRYFYEAFKQFIFNITMLGTAKYTESTLVICYIKYHVNFWYVKHANNKVTMAHRSLTRTFTFM